MEEHKVKPAYTKKHGDGQVGSSILSVLRERVVGLGRSDDTRKEHTGDGDRIDHDEQVH